MGDFWMMMIMVEVAMKNVAYALNTVIL